MPSTADKNLIDAVKKSNFSLVEKSIKDGANVNVPFNMGDEKNTCPLHVSVIKSDNTIVELLLSNGADVNAKCSSGYTALMHAVDNYETTKLLLDHRADPNLTTSQIQESRSALLLAAHGSWGIPREESLRILKLLLSRGANLLSTDAFGKNALDYAHDATLPPETKSDPVEKFLKEKGLSKK